MSDFGKNPKKPFEVRVPNSIRKRIVMHHEEPDAGFGAIEALKSLKLLLSPPSVAPRKRGSMWSRFINGVGNFFK